MVGKVAGEADAPKTRKIEEMTQKDKKPMKDEMIQRRKAPEILSDE